MGGPGTPHTQILADTITAIADHIDPSQNLLLAGDDDLLALVNAQTLAARLDRPLRVDIAPAAASNQDTVIWLGDASTAADYLVAMRVHAPDAPFWLAFNGDTPIFAQRVLRTPGPDGEVVLLGPVYWTVWLEDGYASWAETHAQHAHRLRHLPRHPTRHRPNHRRRHRHPNPAPAHLPTQPDGSSTCQKNRSQCSLIISTGTRTTHYAPRKINANP
ncbi:MAG: hypothetical protein R2873_06580 [Caldilineaceae bacterium]